MAKMLKCYIILARNSEGKIFGLTEGSFNIGMDESMVRVFRPNEWTPKEVQGLLDKMQESKPYLDFFIARVGSKKCPVSIHWNDFYHLKNKGKITKYEWRNLYFNIK